MLVRLSHTISESPRKRPLSQNETGRFNKRYGGRLLKRPVWGTFVDEQVNSCGQSALLSRLVRVVCLRREFQIHYGPQRRDAAAAAIRNIARGREEEVPVG
jgi:hypothetical protein